ncbi:MAG: hypothetical protein H8K06_13360 [Nitrospira sp.]|nr:hypothetical protein [Nitrospira sp.]
MASKYGICDLLGTGFRLRKILRQPMFNRKRPVVFGQILYGNKVLSASIAALRWGGDNVPLARGVLEDGLYHTRQTVPFQC